MKKLKKMTQILENFKTYASPVLGRYFDSFVVSHGKGIYLYDLDGKPYLDFASGIATALTGHSHPKVVKVISDQAKKLIHTCIGVAVYPQYADFCRELATILPIKEPQFFLCQSGAEAVEASIKLAKYATKKTGIVAFRGGFHGRTLGALSVTTSKMKYREAYEPLLPEVYISELDILQVEEIFKNHYYSSRFVLPCSQFTRSVGT